jgi:hypothetical protein
MISSFTLLGARRNADGPRERSEHEGLVHAAIGARGTAGGHERHAGVPARLAGASAKPHELTPSAPDRSTGGGGSAIHLAAGV